VSWRVPRPSCAGYDAPGRQWCRSVDVYPPRLGIGLTPIPRTQRDFVFATPVDRPGRGIAQAQGYPRGWPVGKPTAACCEPEAKPAQVGM
jgi:hypothetical protein